MGPFPLFRRVGGETQACAPTYVELGYLALYLFVPRLNTDPASHFDKPVTCRDVKEFELASTSASGLNAYVRGRSGRDVNRTRCDVG